MNDTPLIPDQQNILIRDAFLGWQCRIRQMAVREHAGYPLPGMRPRLRGPDGRVLAEAITENGGDKLVHGSGGISQLRAE